MPPALVVVVGGSASIALLSADMLDGLPLGDLAALEPLQPFGAC